MSESNMKLDRIAALIVIILLSGARIGFGLLVNPFTDVGTYAKRGEVIVIARCASVRHLTSSDGFSKSNADVIRILKGTKIPYKVLV